MDRLFYDLEVSPNVVLCWRTGHNIDLDPANIIKERQIICAAWKWEGKSTIYSADWGIAQDDRYVLEKLVPELERADQIVAHNGDRFDIKWVRGRCLVHGLSCSADFPTFDTLKAARTKFNLNSYRLDYISKLLGYSGKIDTDYSLWKDVVNGDTAALKKMVKYCKGDVKILEEVFLELESYATPKLHVGVLKGNPRWACPRCGSVDVISRGSVISAAGLVKYRMSCNDCRGFYRIPANVRATMLDELQKLD